MLAKPGKLSWWSELAAISEHVQNTLITGVLFAGTSALLVDPLAGVKVGLAAATVRWCIPAVTWTLEYRTKKDLDGDGFVGKPERIVIRPPGYEPPPQTWDELPPKKRVRDVHKLATVMMRRQGSGLAAGQKALEGLRLPSGFELTRGLHSQIVEILREAGFARRKGRGFEIVPPGNMTDFERALENAIRAEEW